MDCRVGRKEQFIFTKKAYILICNQYLSENILAPHDCENKLWCHCLPLSKNWKQYFVIWGFKDKYISSSYKVRLLWGRTFPESQIHLTTFELHAPVLIYCHLKNSLILSFIGSLFLAFWKGNPWRHIPPGPSQWRARGSPGCGSQEFPGCWAWGGTELATSCSCSRWQCCGGGRISSCGCPWPHPSSQSISTRDKVQMESPRRWNWRRQWNF